MTDQTLTVDQLLQSVLDDIISNMPAALSPKVFHPIKEEPLSDDNKENIPPTPEPFNLEKDLISLYDKEFSDPMLYHAHTQENLLDLINDTDLRLFDSAYCNHRLLAEQEKALHEMRQSLNDMQNSLNMMISKTHRSDLRHIDNAQMRIPALVKKGLEHRLQKILPKQPETVPRTPANSVQSEPALPMLAPSPKPKKGNCPDCRLPYQYDHVAWCRGQVDGWTCHCKPRLSTPFPTEPSPATGSNAVPVRTPLATIYRRKCHTCSSPHHTKTRCPQHTCRYCYRPAPGHLERDCKFKKLRDQRVANRTTTTPPVLPAFSEDDGFYDIHGDEDGNLNGEC